LNIRQVLNELKSQRRQLDKAIAALERVAIARKPRQKTQSAAAQSSKTDRGKLLLFKPPRTSKAKREPGTRDRSERL
jgi:hypothetical protein